MFDVTFRECSLYVYNNISYILNIYIYIYYYIFITFSQINIFNFYWKYIYLKKVYTTSFTINVKKYNST